MNVEAKIKTTVRDILDFPKPGIVFKDITPLLQNSELCKEITEEFAKRVSHLKIEGVAAVESRGFLFGMLIAQKLQVPFIPIRKKGKLPYDTFEESYNLEYGSATIEMHKDAIKPSQNILLHDDLLATGGTIEAASKLIIKAGGNVSAYSFLIELAFLNGSEKIKRFGADLIGLVQY